MHRALLWAASLAFTRLGFVKNNIKNFERTFDVADAPVAHNDGPQNAGSAA